MAEKFLVVIHPAPPEGLGVNGAYARTLARCPTVKTVRAAGAREAADVAGVGPGGYALVVSYDHIVRYDRAMQAPLTERSFA